MKPTILLVMLHLWSFSQISITPIPESHSIGKVAPFGVFCAELEYSIDGQDTLYTLRYRNMEYTHTVNIQSFSFYSTGGSLQGLYNVMKECAAAKDKKVHVTIGKTPLVISTYPSSTTEAVLITTNEGNFNLTDRQIDKLFAKR